MRAILKGLLVLAGVFVVASGIAIVLIDFMASRSRAEIVRIVSEIPRGTPYAAITGRLGSAARVMTNASDMAYWQPPTNRVDRDHCVLHLFPHKAMPYRWILVYTDPKSDEVLYSDWRDM